MRRSWSWIASIVLAFAALAGDEPRLSLVPWKVVEPGAPREASPLVLFWIPSSPDELRRSELLTSDELTLYASQCVAMRVVRLDDFETLQRLDVDVDELPVVVLADEGDKVLANVAATNIVDVEAIVREELHARADAAETLLDEARDKAADGEVEAAIALYRQVWEQRCTCPRQGKAAQKALRKLER